MVAGACRIITHAADRLTYAEACRLAGQAADCGTAATVRIELERTTDTTMGALARLVVLRRQLLRRGVELRITGLHGRARALYEVNGLAGLLPTE